MMTTPHINRNISNATTGMTTEATLTPFSVACPKLHLTAVALEALCLRSGIDIAPGKVDLSAVLDVPAHILAHFQQWGLRKWAVVVQAQLEAHGIRLRKAEAIQVTTRYCYDSWDDDDEAFEVKVGEPEHVVERFLRTNGIVTGYLGRD